MELDDLKKQWHQAIPNASADTVKEAIEKKISNLERSGRGIRRAFWLEMLVVSVMYLCFIGILVYFNNHVMLFIYKIIGLIGLTTIPIMVRLYRMQKRTDDIDYSKDVRSNVIEFVRYYKKSLLIYEWGSYIIVVVTALMLYFDSSFMSLELKLKGLVFGYLVVVMIITRPYIYYVYGRKVSAFEDFLKD